MTILHRSCLLVALALPGVAFADAKKEAEQHIAKATKAHEGGKFDEALAELSAAYKLDPRPELAYAIGQVNVKLGKCDDALASYEKFLDATKDPQAKSLVQQALDACVPAVVEPPPKRIDDPPPKKIDDPPPKKIDNPLPKKIEDDPIPTVTRRVKKPFYKDALGDTLVVVGVASAVVGLSFYQRALSDQDDAPTSGSLDNFNRLNEDARSKRMTAVALIGGGGSSPAASCRTSCATAPRSAASPLPPGRAVDSSPGWGGSDACPRPPRRGGCLKKTEFACDENVAGQCGSGMCLQGFCAFPDPGRCGTNGFSYDESAGSLAGTCTTASMPIDAPDVVDPDAPDGPPSSGCPVGYDPLPGGSPHRYKVLTTPEFWDVQRTACHNTSASAYLAVPDDLTELTAIDGIAGVARYWVGVSDPTEGNYIRDSDNGPQTFLPWKAGQPTGNMEDCVTSLSASHEFDDDRCNTKYPAVCECEP